MHTQQQGGSKPLQHSASQQAPIERGATAGPGFDRDVDLRWLRTSAASLTGDVGNLVKLVTLLSGASSVGDTRLRACAEEPCADRASSLVHCQIDSAAGTPALSPLSKASCAHDAPPSLKLQDTRRAGQHVGRARGGPGAKGLPGGSCERGTPPGHGHAAMFRAEDAASATARPSTAGEVRVRVLAAAASPTPGGDGDDESPRDSTAGGGSSPLAPQSVPACPMCNVVALLDATSASLEACWATLRHKMGAQTAPAHPRDVRQRGCPASPSSASSPPPTSHPPMGSPGRVARHTTRQVPQGGDGATAAPCCMFATSDDETAARMVAAAAARVCALHTATTECWAAFRLCNTLLRYSGC